VPKTLLAVDDSATMRKVLEITFAGEDFRVVSADGASGALAKLGEDPVAVVIDTSLVGDDGYALARDVRAKSAKAAVVLMSSRYHPYDATRGREAGVDDSIDKPFDTQALIDKVKKAIAARESARLAAAAAPVQAPAAAAPGGFANVTRPLVPAGASPAGAATGAKGWSTQRTSTLAFEGVPAAVPPNVTMPSPLSRTAQSPITPPQASAAAPVAAPVAGPSVLTAAPAAHAPTTGALPRPVEARDAAGSFAVNGHFAGKLAELGLTPAQADAVLALSRDLVERVVWEVVPPLAEVLIKEEIARLTKEG